MEGFIGLLMILERVIEMRVIDFKSYFIDYCKELCL